MISVWFLHMCLPFVLSAGSVPHKTKTEDYLNVCMDARHHKIEPGPEDSLFKKCSPWKKRSCCTGDVSQKLHEELWLNFDWDHCGVLSPQCRQHFLEDLCFYECSPNVGPWIVPDKRKIRNERFMNVPLCRSECDRWWNDCRYDKTCMADWSKGFNWTTGTNKCPTGSQCHLFHDVFSNATEFCQNIWGGSWKVVEEGEPCMYLWFDAEMGNPNDDIARHYAKKLLENTGHVLISLKFTAIVMLAFFIWLMNA